MILAIAIGLAIIVIALWIFLLSCMDGDIFDDGFGDLSDDETDEELGESGE